MLSYVLIYYLIISCTLSLWFLSSLILEFSIIPPSPLSVLLCAFLGPSVTEDSKQREHREREEKKRMQMYLSLQASEISSLKAELNMLRRKDVPPLPAMVPVLSYNQNERTYDFVIC